MSPHYEPSWEYTDSGLTLRAGHRRDVVPEPIERWLTSWHGIGLTADAAADLVRMDAELRALVALLRTVLSVADTIVDRARGAVDAAGRTRGWGSQARRRTATITHATAAARHHRAIEDLDAARGLVEVVREFVIQLDPTDGMLRAAAEGWARSAAVPEGVVEFESEERFLTVEPLRADDRGHQVFGVSWRRDGDDDDSTAYAVRGIGRWRAGYIRPTGDIYAAYTPAPAPVWLLGTGFSPRQARTVLDEVMPRMDEPNSLILLADRVRTAQCGDAELLAVPATADVHSPVAVATAGGARYLRLVNLGRPPVDAPASTRQPQSSVDTAVVDVSGDPALFREPS